MKRKHVVIGVLLITIVAAALLGSNMLLSKISLNSQPQMSSDNSQVPVDLSDINNGASQVGPKTIQLNSNASELTVNRGSTVRGTISINVLKADPLRIFVNDNIFNATEPSMPQGVTVSVNMDGHDVSVPYRTSIPEKPNIADLQTTTLGQNSIQYTISASKDAPAGTYRIRLSIQSWLSDGTKWEYGLGYEVILHVQ